MYKQVIDLVENKNMSDYEAENVVYGVDHTQVGERIVNKWKLPQILSNIVTYHKDFTQAPKDMHSLIAVVNLSNMLCEIWNAGFYEGLKSVIFEDTPEWKHIMTVVKGDFDFEQITFELEKDYKDSVTFINIVGK
jgi:HD-like signal output (HDOD) protein